MKTIEKIVKKMVKSLNYSEVDFIESKLHISLPICHSEDEDGNINFDTDSIREQFEEFMLLLDKHNEENPYKWDE